MVAIQPNYDLFHRDMVERQILSAIFNTTEQSGVRLILMKHNLEPKDFRVRIHQQIYTSILECYENKAIPDMVTILNFRPTEYRNGNSKDFDNEIFNIATRGIASSALLEHHIMILKQYCLFEFWNHKATDILYGNWDNRDVIQVGDNIVQSYKNLFTRFTEKLVQNFEDDYASEVKNKVERRAKGLSTGITTSVEVIDNFTGGYSLGELVIIAARPGMGKGLTLDEVIKTPYGNTFVKDIKVNDFICNTSGRISRVLGVYPQRERPIYEITFDDGLKVKADDQHLWEVQDRKIRKAGSNKVLVLSTDELMKQGLYIGNTKRKNFSIKYCKPAIHKERAVLIEPYILGCLIADGYLASKSMGFANEEDDIKDKMQQYLGDAFKRMPMDSRINKCQLHADLDYYGLLNKLSYEKWIPEDYLYNSIENRKAILRGLLDCDGYVVKGSENVIEYSTSSERLKTDIMTLVRGLGGRCSFTERMGKYRKDGVLIETRINYRIWITFPDDFTPVSSEKHLKSYIPKKQFHKRFITAITYVGKEPTICIKVDSPDECFLMNDYLVTHNTTYALISGWNSAMAGNIVVFFSLEMAKNQLKSKLISLLTGIDYKLIKKGAITSEELKAVLEANKYIDNSNFHIEDKIKTIEDITEKATEWTSKGAKLFFMDYIQRCGSRTKMPTRELVTVISRELKSIARDNYVAMVALSQLSRAVEARDNKRPRLSDLKESSSIEEDADIVAFLFRQAYYDEQVGNKPGFAELFHTEFIIGKGRDIGTGMIHLFINPIDMTIHEYNYAGQY